MCGAICPVAPGPRAEQARPDAVAPMLDANNRFDRTECLVRRRINSYGLAPADPLPGVAGRQPPRRAASYRVCTLGTLRSSSPMRSGPLGWVDRKLVPVLPVACVIFFHRLTDASGS